MAYEKVAAWGMSTYLFCQQKYNAVAAVHNFSRNDCV